MEDEINSPVTCVRDLRTSNNCNQSQVWKEAPRLSYLKADVRIAIKVQPSERFESVHWIRLRLNWNRWRAVLCSVPKNFVPLKGRGFLSCITWSLHAVSRRSEGTVCSYGETALNGTWNQKVQMGGHFLQVNCLANFISISQRSFESWMLSRTRLPLHVSDCTTCGVLKELTTL